MEDNQPIVILNRGSDKQKSYELSVVSPNELVCSAADGPQARTDVQVGILNFNNMSYETGHG